MVKILFWVIPKIKEKVGAKKKDHLGIFGYFEELVLNKVGLLAGDMIGWVLALDGKGKPLLGYAVSDGEGNEFEIGSRVKAAKGNNVALMSDMLGIGKNALFYAAGFGNLDVVRFLLSDPRIMVHLTDDFNRTALHYACKKIPGAPYRDASVRALVCQSLVEASARVDERDDHGATP